MSRRSVLPSIAVLALSLALGACGSSSSSSSGTTTSSSSATVSGAGSTFAAPVYNQWSSEIPGFTLNYQAVGSGAGITSLESKTVDFGASDPPLKSEEEAAIAKNGSPAVQIPMFFGAITVSYKVGGLSSGLKLNGTVTAEIFEGKITKWNAPQIAALNPGVKLPSANITVIHRSDSSGTTAGFTAFLASQSAAFAKNVGEGKTVNWPVGTGAKGNAGVAGAIEQTEGSIGYVEQAYALQHKFTYASVKNAAGNYVAPTLASTTAAAEGVEVPANLGIKVTDPKGQNAYPITSQTFIVVNKDLCKAGLPGGEAAAKGVAKLLEFGLGQGQEVLAKADYAKLPSSILEKSKAAAAGLECNGSPLKA